MIARDALRRLLRTRWMLLLLLLTAIALTASAAAGLAWRGALEASLAAPAEENVSDRAEWLDAVRRAEAGETVPAYQGRPTSFTGQAVSPPGPLADFAFAGEAVHPREASRINAFRNEVTLFRRYEISGPVADRLTRFDLSFVAAALLPLVLLLLTFDALTRERDSGRLPLLLAQGARVFELTAVRVAVPTLLLLALLTLVSAGAALLADAPGRLAAWFDWWCVASMHLMFWAVVATAVAVACRQTVTAALAALATWTLLVVALPSLAQFTAEALHPSPSRVAYLSDARAAEAEARRNVDDLAAVYMAEHPQTAAPDDEVPGFHRSAWLANRAIHERTAPVRTAFETSLAERRRFLSRVRAFVPVLLAYGSMEELAATGATHAAAFRGQTLAYHAALMDAIGPAAVGNARLTVAEAEALPDFSFVPPRPPSLVPVLGWLAFASALAAGMVALALRGRAAVFP